LDATSGELVSSFPHQDKVFQAEFSPDGSRILTASRDKTAKLWDAASGKPIASFEHPDGLNHAVFSPDGARILTASGDNTAQLWNAASGKLIDSFDHQDTVPWAGFSPDSTRILTASWDKTAKLWDAATPVELARQVKEAGSDTARMNSSVSIANSPTQQVESLSVIASGLEFSDEGSLIAVNEEQRSKLAKQLKDLAQGVGPNARFMRWFFSPESDRTIFPVSDVKIAEWVPPTDAALSYQCPKHYGNLHHYRWYASIHRSHRAIYRGAVGRLRNGFQFHRRRYPRRDDYFPERRKRPVEVSGTNSPSA
jgi:hypothetical protein